MPADKRRCRGTASDANQPRDWFVEPGLFGRDKPIVLKEARTATEEGARIGARMQHDVALHIRTWLRRHGLRLEDLAAAKGYSPGHWGKVLRGQVSMTFHQLGLARRTIGRDPELTFRAERAQPNEEAG